MTSLLSEPHDRRRRRTRAAVLDAAATLFARDGYRQTSVDALAAAADIALTSLYANFDGGKAHVYAVLACAAAQRHAQRMSQTLQSVAPGGPAARAALTEYVDFHRDEPLAFRLLGLSDVADDPTPAVGIARREIAAILLGVVDEVVDRIADGPLPPRDRVEVREQVVVAWAGINGLLALVERGVIDDDPDGLLRRAVALHTHDLAGDDHAAR
ncbi:TetR/AcrR family transcriptional regulator [Gordonia sp. L191]|uniref:TetR family transcriptional regulator n=1 Tax=Gordonia sp. L191 TaxID=2982699 RepID=UPI0024BFEA20|nr:TetR/AcrR family transcriptional regulator [Gordonia sp. L191]WHU45386.1 TetR/AcrR family transcriptional regulator [Gordonia sp. L191]